MGIIDHFRIAAFALSTILLAFTANGQELLRLQDAKVQAIENNFDIRIARSMAEVERENNTMGNAGYLPTIEANSNIERDLNDTRFVFVSGDVQEGSGLENERFGFAVVMDYTLFGGFAVVNEKQRLEMLEKQGEMALRVQMETTIAGLLATYYEAMAIKQQIAAIESALEISTERLRFTEERLRLGSGSGLEVLQARVDLNADSAALVRQQLELKRMKSVVNELMARDPSIPFELEEGIDLGPQMPYEEVSQKARAANVELFMARNEARITALDQKVAQAAYYPEIALQGLYNFQTSEQEAGFLVESRLSGFTYGLTARWTLFGGFNNRREAKVAKIRAEMGQVGLEQQELQLQGELYRVYESYLTSRRLHRLELRNVEVARENLDIAQEQMRLGSINALELREAQRNSVDAEFRLIQAAFEAKMAETDLLRLSGGLLE